MTNNPVNSSSQDSIDQVIGGFFAAFDNRTGRVPTLQNLSSFFVPNAVVASHSGPVVQVCTVEEFANPRIELLSSGRLLNFVEWETNSETQIIGSLATRRSRYSKNGTLAGQPYAGAGSKFFQLAFLGEAWRIVALSWIDDSSQP